MTYLYRALDQHGQVIDVLVSERRDGPAARAFFTRALKSAPSPGEVTTDRAPVYPRVIDELVPAARHVVEHYANTAVESDHSRPQARERPLGGRETAGAVAACARAGRRRVVAATHTWQAVRESVVTALRVRSC